MIRADLQLPHLEDLAEHPQDGDDRGRDETGQHRADRDLGVLSSRVEHEKGLGRGDAVGVRELLVDDVVASHGNAEEHAQRARGDEPQEDLHAVERDRETEGLVTAQEVERRQDRAHERGLARDGARGLREVRFVAQRDGARDDGQHEVAEERRDDGDVRTEPELEDDVGIGRGDEDGDDQGDEDRAERELAGAGGARECRDVVGCGRVVRGHAGERSEGGAGWERTDGN